MKYLIPVLLISACNPPVPPSPLKEISGKHQLVFHDKDGKPFAAYDDGVVTLVEGATCGDVVATVLQAYNNLLMQTGQSVGKP